MLYKLKLLWGKLHLQYKLILIYIPLIVLPAILGMYFIIQKYSYSNQQMISEYTYDILNLTMEKIDAQTAKYEEISKQFIIDEEFIKLLETIPSNKYETLQQQKKITDKIKVYIADKEIGKYIISIIVRVSDGREYIYGIGNGAIFHIEDKMFMNKIIENAGAVTWFMPNEFVFNSYNYSAFRLGRVIKNQKLKEIGQVTLVIDDNYIRSIMEEIKSNEHMNLYLLGQNGEKVIAYKNISDSNLGEVLTFKASSMDNSWTISAVYPVKYLYAPIQKLTKIAVIILAVFILLGMIGTGILTIDILIPLRALMKNIKLGLKYRDLEQFENIKGAREVIEINNTFIEINQKNHKLTNELIEKEKRQQKMEVQILQKQLSPHFLYNTLNSIRWMAIIQKQINIKEMIDSLIKLLNYSIRNVGQMVLLRDEIEIVKHYITIQKIRYQNLQVNYNITDEFYDAKIIKFIIQPLVENSILHGLAQSNELWKLSIEAIKKEDKMEIVIEDNGIGIKQQELDKLIENLYNVQEENNHIGLKNIHDRVQLHYGKEYGIKIKSNEIKGTKVSVMLPIIF